jgi:type I restriction enzyme R subunit
VRQAESDRQAHLRQFGYPPDMQLLATETVLKQAVMIANELAA